jgi:hypothetical protein
VNNDLSSRAPSDGYDGILTICSKDLMEETIYEEKLSKASDALDAVEDTESQLDAQYDTYTVDDPRPACPAWLYYAVRR